MADSDKDTGVMTPSWQQAASTAAMSESSSHTTADRTSTLGRARRFLQDEKVSSSSWEKKVEFLKTKGIEEADVKQLLEETEDTTTPTNITTKESEKAVPNPNTKPMVLSTPEQEPQPQPQPQETPPPDRPPVITYPEFLTKPTKPPPLITASGLLNSLGIVAGLSTLVYGATRHLVGPMVDALTDARIDLHDTADKNLARLVEKLEHSVSEIPPSYHAVGKRSTTTTAPGAQYNKTSDHADADSDDASSYDDPTELFHRDVGVQTSPPPTPGPSLNTAHPRGADGWLSSTSGNNKNKPGSDTQKQADKLRDIISTVRGLSGALVSQAEDLAATKDVLDRFGQDLYALTYPPDSFGAGSSYLYGGAGRAEPDDEARRVKNSIRGVKGVLLSTRSFPSVMK